MTRKEAVCALVVAAGLVAAGLVWLFGPLGLIVSGIGVGALVLFVVEIREEHRAEPVAGPARPSGPR